MRIRHGFCVLATLLLTACGLDRPPEQVSFEGQLAPALAAMKGIQIDFSNPARTQVASQNAAARLSAVQRPSQVNNWKCKFQQVSLDTPAMYLRDDRGVVIWNSNIKWALHCDGDVKYMLLLSEGDSQTNFVASLQSGNVLTFSGNLRPLLGDVLPVVPSRVSR